MRNTGASGARFFFRFTQWNVVHVVIPLTADVPRLSGGGRTRISSGSLCPAKIKATGHDQDGGSG